MANNNGVFNNMNFASTFKSVFQWMNPLKKGTIAQSRADIDVLKGEVTVDPIIGLPYGMPKYSDTAISLFLAGLKIDEYRNELYDQYSIAKDNYLIQSVIEVMTDDTLKPDKGSGNIVRLRVKDSKINKHLERLHDRIDFDSILSDITPDILTYGEYALQIKGERGKGIYDLVEVYDIKDILPIYKGGKIRKYLVKEHTDDDYGGAMIASDRDPFEIKELSDYLYFVRAGKRIKVKVDYNDFNYDANNSVAGSIRIGRSVIPTSLLPLIKSLTTLEMILPVIRLTQLDKRSLIGVRLPGVTRLDKAAEIAREYERVINDTFRTTSIAMTGEISVPDLIANITKYRVIPLLGDKGSIEMQEIPSPELGSMDDFDYIKKTIFEGIGVPSGYILGGEGGNDNLKTYVRYLKKVASIQRALVVGLKHVGSVHLRLLGYNITPNDIEVDFANIISIENLDELEFLDILTSLLKNYYDFIRDLDDESGPTGKVVDWGEVLRFLHDKMKSFAGSEKFLDAHILSLDKLAGKTKTQVPGASIEPGLKRGNEKPKSEEPGKQEKPETSAPTNIGPPEKPEKPAGGRVTGKPEEPGKFT